jgi:23S rRNA (adenine1618-N6)-methyltransferase
MSTTVKPLVQRPYYHENVNFEALALQDEDFATLLRSNDGRIDWQDPLAIQ